MNQTGKYVDVLVRCVAADDVSMTLRTRTPVCGARTTAIHRLGRLRATGAIEEFEVQTWPDEVVLSDTTTADVPVRTFERFERWADSNGVSVRPAFDVRTLGSLVGPSRDVLTLPMMSLELSSGDELIGVFPYQDGGRTVTIGDCLDAYELRIDDETDDTDGASERADSDSGTDGQSGVESVSP